MNECEHVSIILHDLLFRKTNVKSRQTMAKPNPVVASIMYTTVTPKDTVTTFKFGTPSIGTPSDVS